MFCYISDSSGIQLGRHDGRGREMRYSRSRKVRGGRLASMPPGDIVAAEYMAAWSTEGVR